MSCGIFLLDHVLVHGCWRDLIKAVVEDSLETQLYKVIQNLSFNVRVGLEQ